MGFSNEVRRMNPCFGKFAALAALIAYSIIRAPHGMRSRTIRVAEDRKGKLEIALLAGALLGAFLPAIWAVTGFRRGPITRSIPRPMRWDCSCSWWDSGCSNEPISIWGPTGRSPYRRATATAW